MADLSLLERACGPRVRRVDPRTLQTSLLSVRTGSNGAACFVHCSLPHKGVISESKRIETLVAKVKGEIQDQFIFAGQSGASSRKEMFLKRADGRIAEVAPYVSEARLLVDNPKLDNSSDEDLTRALTRFEGLLTESRRVREDLERELSSLEADNRLYREKRIS